ncbi:MAG: S1C family serine protease [Chthoniobacterales bacterium]
MSIRSHSRFCVAVIGLTLTIPLCAAPPAPKAPAPKPKDNAIEQLVDRVRDVYLQNKDAVVRIIATDRYGKLSGTGFFTDPSGTIYTLAAIVDGATEVEVYHKDKVYPARILVSDPRSGIAILKVDATMTPFLPTKGASGLEVASPVLAIGYPMDLPSSPTFGIVAGFDRKYLTQYFNTTHIRANLPVQQGQGGSPVLNIDGKVVGIVDSCINGGTGCYILPIEAVEKVRGDFMRFGSIKHGWIGVHVEDADASKGSTARIVDLDINSPANGSGLQSGDILLRIGNTKIAHAEDIVDASYFLTAGDVTPIVVVRDGKEYTMHVKPDVHPITRQMAQSANILNFFVKSAPSPEATK